MISQTRIIGFKCLAIALHNATKNEARHGNKIACIKGIFGRKSSQNHKNTDAECHDKRRNESRNEIAFHGQPRLADRHNRSQHCQQHHPKDIQCDVVHAENKLQHDASQSQITHHFSQSQGKLTLQIELIEINQIYRDTQQYHEDTDTHKTNIHCLFYLIITVRAVTYRTAPLLLHRQQLSQSVRPKPCTAVDSPSFQAS